ncbi:PREDICTED: collagen alpha-1(III) chain-like, partial [Nipponia nippon]|uniref:collagen alpha-1(III) chain-like n=1 Tax=Nipponia nippon TaxID=128390 RepID=UPI000510DC8C
CTPPWCRGTEAELTCPAALDAAARGTAGSAAGLRRWRHRAPPGTGGMGQVLRSGTLRTPNVPEHPAPQRGWTCEVGPQGPARRGQQGPPCQLGPPPKLDWRWGSPTPAGGTQVLQGRGNGGGPQCGAAVLNRGEDG